VALEAEARTSTRLDGRQVMPRMRGTIRRGLEGVSVALTLVAASWTSARAGGFDDVVIDSFELPEAGAALEDDDEDDDVSLIVVPVPIVDPTLGVGVAPASLVTFSASEDPTAPRSTFGLVAAYTERENRLLGAGLQLSLAEDHWRIGLLGGYAALNLDYYGSGGDSFLSDDPIGFELEGFALNATLKRRVGRGAYVGVIARSAVADIRLSLPIDVLPTLSADFELGGLGLVATYDTRNDPWAPREGDHWNAVAIRYENSLGFDREFGAVDVDAARYWPVGDEVVIAAQARVATAGDEAPFYMRPFLNFRGFPAGRWLDSVVAQVQGEFRWSFSRMFGAVAFAGAGVVAGGFDELINGAGTYSFGGDLRYRVSRA
jgi:hypothetical protein